MEFILLKVLPAIEDSDTNSLPDLSEANVSLNGKSELRGQYEVFKVQLIEWCEPELGGHGQLRGGRTPATGKLKAWQT